MVAGELVVNIAVKGGEKSVQAVTGVQKGMSSLASTSLEAKAAIIAAFYALERLTSNSAQAGMGLQQFASLTGLSTDRLQRWQYMARQSGVAAEDIAGSIKGVQNAMSNLILGKGQPEGMGMFETVVKFDRSRMRDTFYVMDKLREFAQATRNTPDVSNSVLKGFNLTDGTIQMMRTSRMELDKISPKNLYNSSEISKLAQVRTAWANLFAEWETHFGKLNAKQGLPIVQDVAKLSKELLHLIEVLSKLGEKLHVFDFMHEIFNGVSGIAKIFGQTGNALLGNSNFKSGEKNELGKSIYPWLGKMSESLAGFGSSHSQQYLNSLKPIPNMSMTIHNHGVKDAKDAAQLHKKAMRDVIKQFNGNGE